MEEVGLQYKILFSEKCYKMVGSSWVAATSMIDGRNGFTMNTVGNVILVTGGFNAHITAHV